MVIRWDLAGLRILLGIFFALVLGGCSHYVFNDEGFVRPPKDFKFCYRKKSAKLTDNKVIDTGSIYYISDSNYYRDRDDYKNGDGYIRFYSNGKFKMQGTKEFPGLDEINNINYGIVGYYKLKGNVVKLQIYTDLNAGSDQLEFGIVDEGGDLILLNENPRTSYCLGYSEKAIRREIDQPSMFSMKLNPKVYRKIKVDGMTFVQPDW